MVSLGVLAERLGLSPQSLLRPDRTIVRWMIDSREQMAPEGTLFFALVGERHNGHIFISELYARGFRNFVVSQTPDRQAFGDANFLVVADTLAALQRLARLHRQQFAYPVVGITGSNGKTIVKEWLSQLAANTFEVVKSPKSFNSQVGVPLSLQQMRSHHTLGVFEAGISQPGEMERLAEMIFPTFGIFTNLGTAHDEGFDSAAQKLEEKGLLFEHCERVVYCADHARIRAWAEETLQPEQRLAWSLEYPQAPWRAQVQGRMLYMTYEEEVYSFRLPFADEVSRENVIHCLVLLLSIGVSAEAIEEGLDLLRPAAMRLAVKEGMHDCTLIDDTYNNDLAGLDVALHFMDRQPARDTKVVILSDILETKRSGPELYAAIAERMRTHRIDRVLGVGRSFSQQSHQFGDDITTFGTTEALLQALPTLGLEKANILVKGARIFGFERVVDALEQKIHGTVLEVDLEALTHNLNYYRRRLKGDTKLMVMVKAMAYGSGSHEVAHLLQYHRVDYLGVAYADEGVSLREADIRLPIMVMNPSPESFDKLLEHTLEPEIYSFGLLEAFGQFLRRRQRKARVHLKIDTGMHRLGFVPEDAERLQALLQEYPEIEPVSAFSHLAGADDPAHTAFSRRQAAAFEGVAEALELGLGRMLIKHLVNSSGILRFPEYHYDMVRLGIGLYGVEASGLDMDALRPISRLKTVVSQVKQVPAGSSVGYSRRGQVDKDSTLATLAIGYADGFSRAFSNGVGEVLIRGQRAPVVGNVCMDMTMVDVTGLEVREGDEAIVFGPELPLAELAQKVNTIPYEILTNVSGRVKRVYYTS